MWSPDAPDLSPLYRARQRRACWLQPACNPLTPWRWHLVFFSLSRKWDWLRERHLTTFFPGASALLLQLSPLFSRLLSPSNPLAIEGWQYIQLLGATSENFPDLRRGGTPYSSFQTLMRQLCRFRRRHHHGYDHENRVYALEAEVRTPPRTSTFREMKRASAETKA